MEKEEFLDKVSKFSREDFRNYLYKSSNKKQKLLQIVTIIDSDEKKEKK